MGFDRDWNESELTDSGCTTAHKQLKQKEGHAGSRMRAWDVAGTCSHTVGAKLVGAAVGAAVGAVVGAADRPNT